MAKFTQPLAKRDRPLTEIKLPTTKADLLRDETHEMEANPDLPDDAETIEDEDGEYREESIDRDSLPGQDEDGGSEVEGDEPEIEVPDEILHDDYEPDLNPRTQSNPHLEEEDADVLPANQNDLETYDEDTDPEINTGEDGREITDLDHFETQPNTGDEFDSDTYTDPTKLKGETDNGQQENSGQVRGRQLQEAGKEVGQGIKTQQTDSKGKEINQTRPNSPVEVRKLTKTESLAREEHKKRIAAGRQKMLSLLPDPATCLIWIEANGLQVMSGENDKKQKTSHVLNAHSQSLGSGESIQAACFAAGLRKGWTA